MARVVHFTDLIRPGGGPAGYLYNLHNGLVERGGTESVVVLAQNATDLRISVVEGVGFRKKISHLVLNGIRSFKGYFFFPSFCFWVVAWLYERRNWSKSHSESFYENIQPKDIVIFHSVKTACRALKDRGTKFSELWVMPHGPVTHADERVSGYVEKFGKSFLSGYIRKKINQIELFAFKSANGLIVANENACESYFFDFPALRREFVDLRSEYVLSGVPRAKVTVEAAEVRSTLGIGAEEAMVGFFGRYNRDKGFDYFLTAAKLLKGRNQSITAICAGTGSLEKNVNGSVVRNLGWRQDIGNLIAASDVVVVPNRHTYFDLIVLEALSVGTPVVTSDVGGHRYYRDKDMGVLLYRAEDPDDCCFKIEDVLMDKQQMRRKAQTAYDSQFSIPAFVDRHITLASILLRGKSKS